MLQGRSGSEVILEYSGLFVSLKHPRRVLLKEQLPISSYLLPIVTFSLITCSSNTFNVITFNMSPSCRIKYKVKTHIPYICNINICICALTVISLRHFKLERDWVCFAGAPCWRVLLPCCRFQAHSPAPCIATHRWLSLSSQACRWV